jgi:hypothetical protein
MNEISGYGNGEISMVMWVIMLYGLAGRFYVLE